MKIFYNPDTSEIEIEANKLELVEFSKKLLQSKATMNSDTVEVSNNDPYPCFCTSVQINQIKGQRVKIFYDKSKTLIISGDQNMLKTFSENIENLSTNEYEVGEHIHIEYFTDHYYLANDSYPLVVKKVA